MTQVVRQSGESVERLISRFRRQVIRKGTINERRANQYHTKEPSKMQKRQRAQYREKRRKQLEREAMGLQ